MIKYIFFDLANTLLYKPALFGIIHKILINEGFEGSLSEIKLKHKLLSETIKFPDSTNKEFYQYFNFKLLLNLGVKPTQNLLDTLFSQLTYLPWKPFDDVKCLEHLNFPMGIVSNWDSSLKKTVTVILSFFPKIIIGSKDFGFAKPDIRIYQEVIRQAGVAPAEVLYVGDSIELDILPAEQVGINAVLIDRDQVYPHYKGQKISSLCELILLIKDTYSDII